MQIIAILWVSAVLGELLLYSVPQRWHSRLFFGWLIGGLIAFSTTSLITWRPNIVTILLGTTSIFRLINIGRVLENRISPYYLTAVCRRTTLVFLVYQVIILTIWSLLQKFPNKFSIIITITIILVVNAILLLLSVIRNIRKTRTVTNPQPLKTFEQSTLSVCIPARNETEDLEECLQSLVTSDYVKLEILVLDDCSQTKHTAEIIRGFAQDGVQFINGTPPPQHWLAKNWAYEQLLHQASGDIVLFCGVDVRFQSESLSDLVANLVRKNKSMISILPERKSAPSIPLIQSMRYYWELVPPRRYFNRPPVLSTCWLAKRDLIKKAGSFDAVKQSIVPEAHFAKSFILHDGYSFLRGGKGLGVSSMKSSVEQRATAIRTRYPQLHRRPEMTYLFSVIELAFLIAPFGLVFAVLWLHSWWLISILGATTVLLLIIGYEFVVRISMSRGVVAGSIIFPLAVITDICLMNYSMLKYEFSEVQWKDRNICIPVMRMITD